MFMHITGFDLYAQNMGKTCAIVRVGHSWMDITAINLFDQNVVIACAKARLRFT